MKNTRLFIRCIVMLFTISLLLSACGTPIQEEWHTVLLGKHLPTPQKGTLRSGSNLDDLFMGGIDGVDLAYYAEYKQACINMGYTIEIEESGNSYEAFNSDGYRLSIYFYSDEISITFEAPEQLSMIEWPASGIGSMLPVPSSTFGKITSDTSNSFKIIVGNMTLNDFKAYVKLCEETGFNVDYTKTNDSFGAKDTDGYRLNVRYVGCSRIEIMIQTPKQETVTPPLESNPEETVPTESNENNELRPEFKSAMDNYEAFMDDYVAFMKKYLANPSDPSLMADYTKFMTNYTEFMADFDAWGNNEMNSAELTYYLEVQNRVTNKLLEITN